MELSNITASNMKEFANREVKDLNYFLQEIYETAKNKKTLIYYKDYKINNNIKNELENRGFYVCVDKNSTFISWEYLIK